MNSASESVAFAAYSSPWYEANLKYQKLVLIIMIRSQQMQQLTAYKFANVNMETYYWVNFKFLNFIYLFI